jgi:type VI secretion system protein ImpE
MTPRQLLDCGKLNDALRALTTEVRDNPSDVKRRTFLFELLCFAGEFDRAEKHLDVLAQENQSASLGTLLYRTALHAERLRTDLFTKKEYPMNSGEMETEKPRSGTLNGTQFQAFVDADSRIGSRLEVFAAGSYMWIPFEHIESISIPAPRRLRDLLWAPAIVRTGPAFRERELGELFLPVLSPFSWKHPDDAVRLGRATVWETEESGEAVPFGQKVFLVDDEELPILELRSLQFTAPSGAA